MTLKKLFDVPTEAQISAFEGRYRLTLPEQYREFLKQRNGGQPTPNKCYIPDCRESALVDLLYGIGSAGDAGDLPTEYDRIREELPDGFLPIGHDPGGNYLLLRVTGSGEVFYWDATHFFSGSDDSGDTYMVSPGWNDFLFSLTS